MSKKQFYGRIKEEKSKGVLTMNKEELKEQVDDNQTELLATEETSEMESQEIVPPEEPTTHKEENKPEEARFYTS